MYTVEISKKITIFLIVMGSLNILCSEKLSRSDSSEKKTRAYQAEGLNHDLVRIYFGNIEYELNLDSPGVNCIKKSDFNMFHFPIDSFNEYILTFKDKRKLQYLKQNKNKIFQFSTMEDLDLLCDDLNNNKSTTYPDKSKINQVINAAFMANFLLRQGMLNSLFVPHDMLVKISNGFLKAYFTSFQEKNT